MLHCPMYEEQRATLFQGLRALFPSQETFQQFRGVNDVVLVANVLSDVFWGKLGKGAAANALVCGYLAGAWGEREQHLPV